MKRVGLILLSVLTMALFLVSCETTDTPTGTENAFPVESMSEGNLNPEDPGSTMATDATIHRPIEEFLQAQVPASGPAWPWGDITGWSGYPPGWSNPLNWPDYYPNWVYVDWAALAYQYFLPGLDLGTVITGDVMEQSLNGGGRRVHVDLHGTNCWTIGVIYDTSLPPTQIWPITIGHNPWDPYQPGETPLVSNCHMQIRWTDGNSPGSALPNFYSQETPWWSILTLTHWNFDSNSGISPLTNQPAYEPWGLTPWETGTPGRAMIHQVVVKSGAWPIEISDVGPVGNP